MNTNEQNQVQEYTEEQENALIALEEQQKEAIKTNTEDIMNLVKDLSDIIERGSRLSLNLFGSSKDNILEQIQEIGGQVHEVSLKMTNKTPTENAALALTAAQRYVREHPVQALGVALGAGYLLSTLIKHKDKNSKEVGTEEIEKMDKK